MQNIDLVTIFVGSQKFTPINLSLVPIRSIYSFFFLVCQSGVDSITWPKSLLETQISSPKQRLWSWIALTGQKGPLKNYNIKVGYTNIHSICHLFCFLKFNSITFIFTDIIPRIFDILHNFTSKILSFRAYIYLLNIW